MSNTYELAALLLQQEDAHHELVRTLRQHLANLDTEVERKGSATYVTYLFFTEHHPELIQEYVELAYATDKDVAKEVVAGFHDEALDLSTLPCTGKDFKPWRL